MSVHAFAIISAGGDKEFYSELTSKEVEDNALSFSVSSAM